MVASTANGLDVEHDPRLQEAQAQLTRLQRALGLKVRIQDKDLDSKQYGDKLESIDAEKPVPHIREGDAVIISVHVDLETNAEGKPTYVRCGTAVLDTRKLADCAARDMVSKIHLRTGFRYGKLGAQETVTADQLASFRQAIALCFEPPYNIDFAFGSLSDVLKRRIIRGVQRNFILIVDEKAAFLKHLEVLGCQPKFHPHVLDIMDVHELYQAYEVRRQQSHCKPANRPLFGANWDTPESITSICDQLKCAIVGDVQISGDQARCKLVAVLKMAVSEATNATWLRAVEQLDGGDYPGPWRKLETSEKVAEFLFEHYLAVTKPLNMADIQALVTTQYDSFKQGNTSAEVCKDSRLAVAKAYATTLGYTEMLAILSGDRGRRDIETSKCSTHQPIPPAIEARPLSTATAPAATSEPRPGRLAKPEPCATKEAGLNSAPATSKAPPTPPTTPSPPPPTKTPVLGVPFPIRKGEPLPPKLIKVMDEYHRDGAQLNSKLAALVKPHFTPFQQSDMWKETGRLKCHYYKKIAKAIKGTLSADLTKKITTAMSVLINKRKELRSWHDALLVGDERRAKNEDHQLYIDTMTDARAILLAK